LFGFNYAPQGWLPCDGRALAIAEYDVLFALLGTTYGGDGQNTFNLPDLRGRVAMGAGPAVSLGQAAGAESVTLTAGQMPAPPHTFFASSSPQNSATPSNCVPAVGPVMYGAGPAGAAMAVQVSSAGGNQPHENRQPYLAMNWCIATEGIFPPHQ
jgi:microcystin-dependent protein